MRRPLVLFLLLALLGTEGSCMAIERPKYTVELQVKPFEVRDYAPMITATVHVDGNRSDAVNAGFRILAGYIFGDNQLQAKISMTGPVTQRKGQKIAMTAPVQQVATSTGFDIRFIMPVEYDLNTLPKPHNSRITLIRTPATRMASVSFSGFWTDSNFQTHQDQLRDFLQKRQFTIVSAPIYAYYNAPWTPWFLRTNEVLFEMTLPSP